MFFNTDSSLWENSRDLEPLLLIFDEGDVYSDTQKGFVARFRTQEDAVGVFREAGYTIHPADPQGRIKATFTPPPPAEPEPPRPWSEICHHRPRNPATKKPKKKP